MTTIRNIKTISDNKIIKSVTTDDSINIILLKNNEIFRYINGDKKNKIIVAQFSYFGKVVSQAFYECCGEYKGTWLPFDGIKANISEENTFFKYLDDSAFKTELYPFGDLILMAVSYILGGGVWGRIKTKYKEMLGVEERMSVLELYGIKDVSFEDSLVINHYINYSISRNYYQSNPEKSFRPKSPQWIKNTKNLDNDQKLFSAFDFSFKMNNSRQIEYTPPLMPKFNKRSDYEDFYKSIDLTITDNEEKNISCTIL